MQYKLILFLLLLITVGCSPRVFDEETSEKVIDKNVVLGRWDLTIYDIHGVYPSWLEISDTDGEYTGRFVGRFGHARPADYIHFDGDELYFSVRRQYEKPQEDLLFIGHIKDGKIDGKTKSESGKIIRFSAQKVPKLQHQGEPEWGETINLIGNDLSNWEPRDLTSDNNWKVENSVLKNAKKGADLVTNQKFKDFKLHLEFKIPKNSNSGVYLRGRYEVQIEDNYGEEPGNRLAGGVYGFITPKKNMIKPVGQWNYFDITLVGRNLTIVFNEEKIIDNEEIPGITGGAINSRETEAGPIMLQGDHGVIEYRNILLTPAK